MILHTKKCIPLLSTRT